MTQLTGSGQAIPLGNNYRIRAPGITGTANVSLKRATTGATRSISIASEGEALDRALASQEMEDVATIDVTIERQVAPPAGAPLRGPTGEDVMELEVPAPPPGYDTMVLAVDESGAITWNLPITEDNQLALPATRGAGASVYFRIPSTPAVTPPPGTQGTRSIFGAIGKKILKVLIYPITDRLVGPLVDMFANKWEGKNRPYRLRTVTPDNYASKDVANLETNNNEWGRLNGGRSLLFVHGTTSSTHTAFSGLAREDVEALSQAYGGRLFGFDHFTLSHSPALNAQVLSQRLPPGLALDADIVCHSRGGLVAREIVERSARNGLTDRLKVGEVVFVGVPNAGTALAEPDHMIHMIDRLTTAINFLPDGPATWILEGIITAVKVIGHGGLKSLDGLAAMNPKGTYLEGLAEEPRSNVRYRGIAADFNAQGTVFDRLSLKSIGGRIVDRIFDKEANDLVVPTAGVSKAMGGGFPILPAEMLQLAATSGVTHTTYFSNPQVREQLRAWLVG